MKNRSAQRLKSQCGPVLLQYLLIFRNKDIFAHSAERTYPILRKIFKSCAWIDSVVRISISRIIYVSTWLTNVFLHNSHLFLSLIPYFTRYVTILQPVQRNIWGPGRLSEACRIVFGLNSDEKQGNCQKIL